MGPIGLEPMTLSHFPQMVREQRIPFAISMDVPNADTIRAIDDVRHGRNVSL